jgi:uncharacterized membrane protein
VRFHAAQSLVVFGSLFVIRLVLLFVSLSVGFFGVGVIFGLISLVLFFIGLAAWIILMIMAYQGKQFEVPIAAGIAKNIAAKV